MKLQNLNHYHYKTGHRQCTQRQNAGKFGLHFFIAAHTVQVAQPMLFKWAAQLVQSGQI